MQQSTLLFCCILPFLLSYVAAKPILQPRQLERRGVAPLWNESGPSVRDVKQVKTLNCWWAASSLAVLMSSQKWVEDMVKYGNGSSMTGQSWPKDSTVQVTVWNPNSGSKETFTADQNYISQTEDHPNGNWWHEAIGQGAKAMGKTDSFIGVISGSNPDWDPKSGSATIGLKILTGFETDSSYQQFLTIDEFFELAKKASTGTPVIFNTLSKEQVGITIPQLGHSHDYAIYNGSINPNGERVIWARNSWGSTDAFKLEDVYNNSYQIIHLRDWNVLGSGPTDMTHQDAPDVSTNGTTSTNSTSIPSSTQTNTDDTSTTASTGSAGSVSDAASTSSAMPTGETTTTSDSIASPSSGTSQAAGSADVGTTSAPSTSDGANILPWTSTLPGSSWTLPASILTTYTFKN
ncbi:uncharacterized protein I206_104561 [Kwoniella pini CBS 10737]|uniref:Calpain catalytic domain-containing protein n=1 Tax=Kwoniella pini CBS 10737 TaxID=1296096 RepID=A0A1B9I7E9_9TREE|nr:uncharacterized protein I206_02095 [Kwoniella pini CBS 10737]OCF51381.1 hypothetical protein I206_02095 [Kwoniella pini CBS 10737]